MFTLMFNHSDVSCLSASVFSTFLFIHFASAFCSFWPLSCPFHSSSSSSNRSFLFSKEGNPNKRNVHNETCLHVLCQGPQILLLPEGALSPRLARPQRDEQRRADCLQVQTTRASAGRGVDTSVTSSVCSDDPELDWGQTGGRPVREG